MESGFRGIRTAIHLMSGLRRTRKYWVTAYLNIMQAGIIPSSMETWILT